MGSRGRERLMSCDGFDEPPKRLQQQHPTHGHGSPTAIPSHPILRRRTSYCSTMHGHGLGLGSTTAVAPLRASPPPPGTTTAIPALRFPFPLNWVGARTRPLFFFYPLFCPPFSSDPSSDSRLSPGRSWLPFAVSLHELVVLGASHLGIVACLLLAAIGFPGGYLRRPFPFLS